MINYAIHINKLRSLIATNASKENLEKAGYTKAKLEEIQEGISSKNKIATILLCIFLGFLGVHRFYAGKIGTGVVWLLTGGCFLIGWIVDIITICTNGFKDNYGCVICNVDLDYLIDKFN